MIVFYDDLSQKEAKKVKLGNSGHGKIDSRVKSMENNT